VTTIEDLITAGDRRGIALLRPHLSHAFATDAASLLLAHGTRVLVATGFFIRSAGAAETDGPPGAAALGEALAALGARVAYVTDRACVDVVRAAAPGAPVYGVDAADEALAVARSFDPTALVAIERCGASADGVYRDFRGRDISGVVAPLDPLFGGVPSVGIGDGGNEIGMGNLADVIARTPPLPTAPCVTCVTHLVVASVSNWGGYGVVRALELLTGRALQQPAAREERRLLRCVEAGAVDGITGRAEATVDGLPTAVTNALLASLREVAPRDVAG
jgi:hypothetical protein